MSFFDLTFITENQQVQLPILKEKGVELWIKREDAIHPEVSGNKFRKLKYNLLEAKKYGKRKLLTFGGAFSNHILATAFAANLEGMESIGVIRGEELAHDLKQTLQQNSTLKKAVEMGMQLHFVSRSDYREKTSDAFLATLKLQYGDFYLIPEGGTNPLAIRGCKEILTDQDEQFTYICSSVGTGGTVSGLIQSAQPHQKILAFPALKGDFLREEIENKNSIHNDWRMIENYHFGGYGKYSKNLIEFINEFKRKHSIQLDPIYTGKMLFGILDLVRNDFFEEGAKILAIHTGGLQGIEGFNQMLTKKNSSLQIHL